MYKNKRQAGKGKVCANVFSKRENICSRTRVSVLLFLLLSPLSYQRSDKWECRVMVPQPVPLTLCDVCLSIAQAFRFSDYNWRWENISLLYIWNICCNFHFLRPVRGDCFVFSSYVRFKKANTPSIFCPTRGAAIGLIPKFWKRPENFAGIRCSKYGYGLFPDVSFFSAGCKMERTKGRPELLLHHRFLCVFCCVMTKRLHVFHDEGY